MDHDIQVVEATDPANERIAMMKAKEIGDVLCRSYPNHLWQVSWQGGAFVVKNLAISAMYGFILPDCDTHTQLTRNAVLAGGELLERAGMKRGAWDGKPAHVLEGSVPRFFNPLVGV